MKFSRRGLIKTAGATLVAVAAGCGIEGAIIPVDPSEAIDLIDEVYNEDVSLPPLSDNPFAQKLYAYPDGMESPEALLYDWDGKYASFSCSPDSPLEIIVGFGVEFSRVTVGYFSDKEINVAGEGMSPVVLAKTSGAKTIRFAPVPGRSEEGYAVPRAELDYGSLQLDVGAGRGRYFRFTACPQSGTAEVGIDFLRAGG